MNYSDLRHSIYRHSATLNFREASQILQQELDSINKESLISLIVEIGTIPEDIQHDSREEKLYTKASDILFAKALRELGLTSRVLDQRGNCADIIAQSSHFGYSLVGDAKAFRLSRTAKNAKDFKVSSMDNWRGDCDYAVLTCPFYQYPRNSSQIYKDALNRNVTLFSWEQIYILLQENIRETPNFSLEGLWKQSQEIFRETTMEQADKNFLSRQHCRILDLVGLNNEQSLSHFNIIKDILRQRASNEILYYEEEINRVQSLSREDAINELLLSMKIDSRIQTIQGFIRQICQE